jgi:phage-related minor tail protein
MQALRVVHLSRNVTSQNTVLVKVNIAQLISTSWTALYVAKKKYLSFIISFFPPILLMI